MTDQVGQTQDPPVSFEQHLDELRRRVVYGLVGIAVVSGATLYFGRELVVWLCGPLLAAQRSAGLPAGAYTLSPMEGFSVYLKVSLILAVILASPFVLYQAWRFIEVGLYANERRALLVVAPFSTGMTVLGLAFMYYVMLPACLWFLISFSTSYHSPNQIPPADAPSSAISPHVPAPAAGDHATRALIPTVTHDPVAPAQGQLWLKLPENQLKLYIDGQTRTIPLASSSLLTPLIDVTRYINFVSAMALGTAIAFQLPVIMLVFGWSGLVNPQRLAKYRKHCIFACFAAGALLTPADVLSMLLLAIPLWSLFELGLLLMRMAYSQPSANTNP